MTLALFVAYGSWIVRVTTIVVLWQYRKEWEVWTFLFLCIGVLCNAILGGTNLSLLLDTGGRGQIMGDWGLALLPLLESVGWLLAITAHGSYSYSVRKHLSETPANEEL